MSTRYEGEAGKRRLAQVLAAQELVQHDGVLAQKLAAVATVEEFGQGKQLYLQGEPGRNVLFFVLRGSVDLSVEGERVATLEAGQFFGEFPIVDPGLNYTVTVLVREESDLASVPEENFISIADKHPEIWKNVARVLVTRLRKANRSRARPSTSTALRAGEVPFVEVWRSITTPQLWTIIVAVVSTLATVATISYKVGKGAW